MRKLSIVFAAVITITGCLRTPLKAQGADSLWNAGTKRNVIKFNVSSLFVYKTALLVEYERVLSRHQSFSIQAGFVTMALGSFLDSDSIHVLDNRKNSGFSITGDYRFYLQKENKDGAPHGVYIGPYVAYLTTRNEYDLQLGSGPNSLKTEIDVLSIGGELGYQFLLGKHWTLDFVLLGPSITNYKAQMQLALPVNASELGPVYQKVLASLANRFPVVSTLVNGQDATFRGKLDAWGTGFRYSMHLGYRF